MDYKTIIDKTYEVVDYIKQTNEYQELMEIKKQIETSLEPLVTKFKSAEEKYVEAMKYGNYHPDLKKYQVELSKIKSELFTNDLVVKYKELEAIIQKNLNSIVSSVTNVVSNKIKPQSSILDKE